MYMRISYGRHNPCTWGGNRGLSYIHDVGGEGSEVPRLRVLPGAPKHCDPLWVDPPLSVGCYERQTEANDTCDLLSQSWLIWTARVIATISLIAWHRPLPKATLEVSVFPL